MRQNGRIVTWKDNQGYGFIAPDNGGPEFFVHVKSFLDGDIRPELDERVSFEPGRDAQGRLFAKYVRREGAAFRLRAVKKVSLPLLALALLFLAGLGVLAFLGHIHRIVPVYYLAFSACTFIAYHQDKAAAKDNEWRTAERTLHTFALLGGWPGALLAQRVLRHKSSKESFLGVFWVTVIVNVGVLGLSLTPQGSRTLYDILHTLYPY